MPEDTLIVPVAIPSGSLHFATILSDGTAQDLIDALLAIPEVESEVLGDLQPHGWALQKIRRERSARQWEEKELEALGDGEYLTGSCSVHFIDATIPKGSYNRPLRSRPC